MNRLTCFLAIACWTAASPAAASPATDFLDLVRSRIDERYYARPGVDVAAIFDAARQRLVKACGPVGETCSVELGIEAAGAAVGELGDSHTRLEQVPPSAGPAGPAGRSTPLGWMVRSVRGGDALYVAWVAPDGPAEQAGVRRHDLIVSPGAAGAAALTGLAEPTRLTLSRGGRSFAAELTPQAGAAGPMPRLDHVGDIALLQVPSGLGDGVAQAAHDLIAQAQKAGSTALILDLRDNGGGGVQCAAMASAFVDYTIVQTDRDGGRRVMTVAPGEVRLVTDDGDVEMLRLERPARWTGPMAILVNDNTASCSEAVAAQAALAGRALIIGEPTLGVGNNVVAPVPLTAGWRLVMTVAYSTTIDGGSLPARPPLDIEVEDDPLEIAATGRDPVLEAAVERLNR